MKMIQLAASFIGLVVILAVAVVLCCAPLLIFEGTYPWTPEHGLAHDFMFFFLLVFGMAALRFVVNFMSNPRSTKEGA
jgi:hypothetical protein